MIDIDDSRLMPEMRAAIIRDHGEAPKITRAFNCADGYFDSFEIENVIWSYSRNGQLVDSYRLTQSRFLEAGRRKEIDKARINPNPVALTFVNVNSSEFFKLARKAEGSVYDHCAAKASTCYSVHCLGDFVGIVVQVRFSASEAADRPQVQWLAVNPTGNVWYSFGHSREEAARHLTLAYFNAVCLAAAA